jgi:hypothetical protein
MYLDIFLRENPQKQFGNIWLIKNVHETTWQVIQHMYTADITTNVWHKTMQHLL